MEGKPAPGQSKAKKGEPRKEKAKTSGKHVPAPAPGTPDHHTLSFYLPLWLLDWIEPGKGIAAGAERKVQMAETLSFYILFFSARLLRC